MATKLKIEKKGDEILIVHCCFSVSQNELKFSLQLQVNIGKSSKFIKNPVTHAEKLIIMLIQFKFGHILA
jgi:hypothetical protein